MRVSHPKGQINNRGKKITKEVTGKVTSEVTQALPLEERRGEKKRVEEKREEKIIERTSLNNTPSLSPLYSNSKPSFNQGELSMNEKFLSMLKGCTGYPFERTKDSLLFDIVFKSCPGINILQQTAKKIEWWKTHPRALEKKSDPRGKLLEWFKKEAEFKKRGSQKVLEIMAEVDDKDHLKWIESFLMKKKRREVKKI